MNYWRMTFKLGTQGEDLWHECLDRGIAGVGEYNDLGKGLPDLRNVSESEFADIWNRNGFRSVTGRQALFSIRYKMTTGDVIYVKGKGEIKGCGVITSEYDYDPDIMGGTAEWEHFVRVNWDQNFKPIPVLLGAERITLIHLYGDKLHNLESLLQASGQSLKVPALEIKSDANDIMQEEQNNASQQAGAGYPPQGVGSPDP
jgi:hypothetical protein